MGQLIYDLVRYFDKDALRQQEKAKSITVAALIFRSTTPIAPFLHRADGKSFYIVFTDC